MANLALIDDHTVLRHGLAMLLKELGHTVVYEANNGKEGLEKLKTSILPEVILLDISMPEMDGYDTAQYLRNYFPEIRVLALSMFDDEMAIIRMVHNGARGYILKDCEPFELTNAIHSVINKGYYHSELVTAKLIHSANNQNKTSSNPNHVLSLTTKDIEFLKLCCTELTYKEIAAKIYVSPRTVDTYRDRLFEKFDIKSRVGLVIYAIKNGIVKV